MNNIKQWFIYSLIALLSACGSQDSTNSTNTDTAGANNYSVATKSVAATKVASQTTDTTVVGTSPKRDLLANLALAYPGGVLPPERAAEAAAQLAQNPAALKYNADIAAKTDVASQAQSFSPQAAASYTVGLSSPVQRAQNTTLFGSYFFSIYPSEMTNALATNPTWNLEGTAFHASLGINPGLAPVWRFRNLINGSYLYTIDNGEKNDIIANYSATFTLEGPAWYASPAPATGYTPLYRFRNVTNGTYLFSAYEAEKDAIVANYAGIFLLEGVSYYVRLTAALELSLLAGSGDFGTADGAGAVASFGTPYGMTKDLAGNVYVSDNSYHTIRKITPAGIVSTFAGSPGVSGSTNGGLSVARFKFPAGIVISSDGAVMFIADAGNCQIRTITMATNSVGTLAGSIASCVDTDGSLPSARFTNGISGLAIDSTGNKLWVTTGSSGKLRLLSGAFVQTLATGLNSPFSVALDSSENAYVTEASGHSIRKITPAGVVSTVAGLTGTSGSANGMGTAARFNLPFGIVNDGADNFYVMEYASPTVRKLTAAGVVTTVAGTVGTNAFVEGFLPSSFSGRGYGITVANGKLYFSVSNTPRIYQINGLP